MKYVFLALISLSLASDVSIDINYAKSKNTNTEIYIEARDEEVRVSIDDYSYPKSGVEGANVYVNVVGANSTTDEAVVSIYNYHNTGYEYNEVAVRVGDSYSKIDETHTVNTNGKGQTNRTENIGYTSYDSNTGKTQKDHVSVNTYTNATKNETQTYTVVDAEVGGFNYQEEAETYVDNVKGEGHGDGEYVFWVNSQSSVGSMFGGFLMTFIVLAAFIAAGVMIYRKLGEETVKKYSARVVPVEECSRYIRI